VALENDKCYLNFFLCVILLETAVIIRGFKVDEENLIENAEGELKLTNNLLLFQFCIS